MTEEKTIRSDGRTPEEMRPVSFTRGFTRHAEGSVLVRMGKTVVLCTASVTAGVPRFLEGKGEGWVTAEYGLLPRSTGTRCDREAAKGKQTGRTQEIQRLIGRSLRAVVDRKRLGNFTIHLDCDVLQAAGGTVYFTRLTLPTRYPVGSSGGSRTLLHNEASRHPEPRVRLTSVMSRR